MKVGLFVLIAVLMVGCAPKSGVTPEKAAEQAGLRRDQFSREATGSNTVTSGDGSETSILPESDLGSFGLALYPNADVKEGNAFRRTTDADSTVLYSLTTEDKPQAVAEFYAKELNAEATKTGSRNDYIVAGKVGDKSAVVTILEEEDGTKIEVQVIEAK